MADVLYGIEARSPFDFLHRYADMRLGAAIAGEDGKRFEFRRRKGNQNTLLDADEAPLPEDALAAFLGSVDRTLFLDAFGLNRERLRAGARRLIDGGGKVGETLLAAAPGLSSLIALRSQLGTKRPTSCFRPDARCRRGPSGRLASAILRRASGCAWTACRPRPCVRRTPVGTRRPKP
jgi:uncharacterized protein YhaN